MVAAVMAAGQVWGQEVGGKKEKDEDVPVEKQTALVAAVQPSMVIVEYTLQYDKGDEPEGAGFSERCPNCGQFHGDHIGEVIKEERPLARAGFLIDGNRVVTTDMQIHPRFIKEIKVKTFAPGAETGTGEGGVTAQIAAYPKNQNAVILQLAGPLSGAKPVAFDPKKTGPYTSVSLEESDGRWVVGLHSVGSGTSGLVIANGKPVVSLEKGLIVDKEGMAVGVSTGIEVPADGSWKGPPAQWSAYSAEEMKGILAKIDGSAAKAVVPVSLSFREPRKANARGPVYRSRGGDEEESGVRHALGVVTDAHTVLILSELKPSVTARLERIRVMTEPPVDATFAGSLTDFGALVAKTESSMTGPLAVSSADALSLQGTQLAAADVRLKGEQRIAYVQPRRIASYTTGWRGHVFPELAGEDKVFLFDGEGKLLALPVMRREKASTSEPKYGRDEDAHLTPVKMLARALADLKANTDPNNVPLTEEQENRLAWLGVEMQALTPELARANKVADQTQDGQTGGLVTFIYPGSPAAKAGVETGWVLLRILAEGEPKPIEVNIESDRFSDQPFPWERLSEAPESVFDRIPTPWPTVETSLVRTLTDMGFGKKFVAEFAHDGKVEKKEFSVAQGPVSYDSAPKYKHDGLGLTVRDMTYEVRRYFQKKEDEPGVVVSKIEMGSKASVAGIKPYEVITHVNDQEVRSVKDFERLAKDQTELRLGVKRMTAGRIVKVSLSGAGGAGGAAMPATGGGE
jgi:hypothetical protein